MRRAAAVMLLAASMVGCANHSVSESPWLVQGDASAPRSCEPLTADQELVLGLSQEMASSGRLHAALANLERLPNELPPVRLNKARLLRLLGHSSEAEALYSGLLNSCLVVDAQHGLGQIAAARGHYPEAQEYLRTAASLSPASEAIRNDLGVVYMNQRRLAEARFELLTAMELSENARGAARNMLTLLVYQGNWQAAQELVSAKGLSSTDFNRAEQRARNMRSEDAKAATPVAVAAQTLATPEPAGTAEAVASVPTAAASAPPVRSVATPPVSASALAVDPVAPPTPAPVPDTARAPLAPASVAARPSTPTPIPVAAAAQALVPAPVNNQAPTPIRAFAAESAAAPARTVTPMPLSAAVRAWAAEEATTSASDAPKQIQDVQQTPPADARPIVCRSSGSSTPGLTVMECLPE